MPDGNKSVKVFFSREDPMDSVILDELAKQKKKSSYIKMAVFCYIKGVNAQSGSTEEQQEEEPAAFDRSLSRQLISIEGISLNGTK